MLRLIVEQYRRLSTDTHVTLVAFSNNRIIGAASMFIEPKFIHNCSAVGHIEDVVVSRELRGSGVGKKLISRLLGIAEEKGCYKIVLDCAEDNIPFYERCGLVRKEVQMVKYFSK